MARLPVVATLYMRSQRHGNARSTTARYLEFALYNRCAKGHQMVHSVHSQSHISRKTFSMRAC